MITHVKNLKPVIERTRCFSFTTSLCVGLLLVYVYVFEMNISLSYVGISDMFNLKNNCTTRVCVYGNISNNKGEKKCFSLSKNINFTTVFAMTSARMKNPYTLTETKDLLGKKNMTSCNRFITRGAHLGRIGNQMFQIASLLGTAHKYDILPIIPENYPINKYFDLPSRIHIDNNESNMVKCKQLKSAVYYNCSRAINTGKNITMLGFCQSWKYFYGAYDIVKSVFRFKDRYLHSAKEFLSRVSLPGYKRVCIHIRRGDITSKKNRNYGYVIADLKFIEKAKEFFRIKYAKVQFIVVSNDKKWCRNYIKDVNISTLSDPGEDLALMTLSDNVVVTTGTFGWWGAWLSGGTTVYFNQYPKNGSVLAAKFIHEDYYPPNWIGLS
ncbi:galactoside alpha-(1,2)-fucosyltransferase 2-like [Ruditapes philippinarum]|uniref:galactoside alpha-(1,2)-fucosyltransferase 2-like n=1 Tax=Ruditapes philippinarum TaxID=129788 RepID=UPI00295A9C86|nr:galactoside alpha-(1,2)-fucosyltransferase 2-like [Ruditapes philippinarum]